jgi:hypothetical protein
MPSIMHVQLPSNETQGAAYIRTWTGTEPVSPPRDWQGPQNKQFFKVVLFVSLFYPYS